MDLERWKGRVALVTGASAGIGFAIAEALVKNGIHVVACARNTLDIQKLREKLNVTDNQLCDIACDLRKEDEILSMFKTVDDKFHRLDILINNAGLAPIAPLIDGDTAKWRAMFEVNVLALCICTKEGLKLMEKAGINDGQIIHINSIAGHNFDIADDFNFYAGTKHMVTCLTKGLNKELRQKNYSKIRVTSISPGEVETRMMEELRKEYNDQSFCNEFTNMQASDVANTVLYTLSLPPDVNIWELTVAPTGQWKP